VQTCDWQDDSKLDGLSGSFPQLQQVSCPFILVVDDYPDTSVKTNITFLVTESTYHDDGVFVNQHAAISILHKVHPRCPSEGDPLIIKRDIDAPSVKHHFIAVDTEWKHLVHNVIPALDGTP
jgi:hypothetical protein